MLEAGGAGTYTPRAIPGSEPGLDSYTFRPYADRCPLINELITTQLGIRSDIRPITYQLRST
jgi:hypothetical protein